MDNTAKQFKELLKERSANFLSIEEFFYDINEIAKDFPKLAKEAMKEYEDSFSNVKKNDTMSFIKYWYNRLVKNDGFNANGLKLEMLSRSLGNFVTEHPEFAEKGFELIKSTTSAKCHDNTSIRYYNETFGDILSICPKKLENDVISAWEKFTDKQSLFKEGRKSFNHYSFYNGIVTAVERKPQLAGKMAQMLDSVLKKHPCENGESFEELKKCWRSIVKADKKLAKVAAVSLLQIRNTKSPEEANSYSYTLDEFYDYLPKSEKVEKTPTEIQKAIDIANRIDNEKRLKKLRDKIAPLGKYFVNGEYRETKTGCHTFEGFIPYYNIFSFEPKAGKPSWSDMGDVKETFSAYLKSPAKIISADYGKTHILRHDGDKHDRYHNAWKINVKADNKDFLIIFPSDHGVIEVLSDDKRLKFEALPKGYQEEERSNNRILTLKSEPVKGQDKQQIVTRAIPVYEYDGNKINIAGANLVKELVTNYGGGLSSRKKLKEKRISVSNFKELETKMKNNELKNYGDFFKEQSQRL